MSLPGVQPKMQPAKETKEALFGTTSPAPSLTFTQMELHFVLLALAFAGLCVRSLE